MCESCTAIDVESMVAKKETDCFNSKLKIGSKETQFPLGWVAVQMALSRPDSTRTPKGLKSEIRTTVIVTTIWEYAGISILFLRRQPLTIEYFQLESTCRTRGLAHVRAWQGYS